MNKGKDYFDEKASQVNPEALTAFGISIFSRYGKASEIKEMISFAESVCAAGISELVQDVFYDSKACTCFITIKVGLFDDFSLQIGKILDCALEHIRQFEWNGCTQHGADWRYRDGL